MKAVILAGGYGAHISEESSVRPKPMVEIGGKPILWPVMKLYSAHAINEFIVCCGYKASIIKQYFANYFLNSADVTFDLRTNSMEVHQAVAEPWKVTLIDSADQTMTGGRLKRVRAYLADETFCMTYGDGVSDLYVTALIAYHRAQHTLATLTADAPCVDVVTTANIDPNAHTRIDELGGYHTYDLAEDSSLAHAAALLPISLAEGCVLRHAVPKDAVLTYADVDLHPGRLCDQLRAEQNAAFYPPDLLVSTPMRLQ